MTKKMLIVFLLLAVAAGYFAYGAFKRKDASSLYTTIKAKRANVVSSVSATGKIMSSTLVSVGTQISGTISDIYVDPNDRVEKGQTLLRLDRKSFLEKVSGAEAGVARARARIEAARAEADRAGSDLRRISELLERGLMPRAEFDNKTQELKAKEALLDEARAGLKDSEATLKVAQDELSKTLITSPMDGVVLDVNVQQGQTVASSFQTPTLLTVANLRLMEVHAFIDEADVGRVKKGQKALFYVDAYPDKEFAAVVDNVYYSPTVEQNVVTYKTVLGVSNEGLLLRQGMTANIRVIIEERRDAIVVPNKALRVRLPEEEARVRKAAGGPSLWVIEDGAPKARKVTLGISDEENTEVVEGLKEGETLIVESTAAGKERRRGISGWH